MTQKFNPGAGLPITAVLADILAGLAQANNLVLQAPPGAGKTTLVPLHLLDQPWAGGQRIILLEPRRLAARAAARRMAEMLGEAVGETVGYRVRLDHRVGPRTRLEVVTEGVLIRQLQKDPLLTGVCAVIFDEFHERALEADFGLALCLDVQRGLREDLKLLVMSATLDGANVARLMGDAPVITSRGRAWPVEMHYLARPAGRTPPRIEARAGEAVLRALDAEKAGDILVFLPGAGEIERCAGLLRAAGPGPGVRVMPLYGMMRAADQDRAIRPAPAGERKVVLATAIAETSLTIDGVRIVIDGGLDRRPRYDVGRGMTRLDTRRLSRAAAEQRAGRAGRLGPGVCYRLWTAAEQRGLTPFAPPEITVADLAPLVLELANWGVTDPAALRWLDVPDPAAVAQAREMLRDLGALDGRGAITAHGREMAGLTLYPRLAHMLLIARARGFGRLALALAALLSERDILRGRGADIRPRLALLLQHLAGNDREARRAGADPGALKQMARQMAVWARALKLPGEDRPEEGFENRAGLCLALAYPERIAGRRSGDDRRYLLSGGQGALLDAADDLCGLDYLAVCDMGQSPPGTRTPEARIYLAAPLSLADIESLFGDRIRVTDDVSWDARGDQVVARRQHLLGRLPLREARLDRPDAARVVAAFCAGLRALGSAALPWTPESAGLRARLLFCRRHDPDGDWPDWSDDALMATLEDWLAPYLGGLTRRDQLKGLKFHDILQDRLDWPQRQRLDRLAPRHVTVPGGSRIAPDYSADPPVLAVRLQEMFGQVATPVVMAGRVPLLLHLLSPAGRPLQVTQDLENFWNAGYESVKKEMRGRYPKHPWPDDPRAAVPTRRAKPRS